MSPSFFAFIWRFFYLNKVDIGNFFQEVKNKWRLDSCDSISAIHDKLYIFYFFLNGHPEYFISFAISWKKDFNYWMHIHQKFMEEFEKWQNKTI